MLENPGDELYFGEVYRTVLQEAWLPEGSEIWQRSGISRRGRRPTQQGLYAHSPTPEQAIIRQCFSKCAAAWNALPWDNPNDPPCDARWGKEYWKKEKDDQGVPCSYYDLFMRSCLKHCIPTTCVMPSAYSISCGPNLEDVVCFGEYPIPFSGACGPISLASGDGMFSPPDIWTAPLCGDEGLLAFKDQNGAQGCLRFSFNPAHNCNGFSWPDTNPAEITPGTQEAIAVEGGAAPFIWEVTGEDFSLSAPGEAGASNILIAGPDACGSAKIKVTDFCGQEIQGAIRSTVGQWVHKGAYCGLTAQGEATETPIGGNDLSYEYILGYQKQTHICDYQITQNYHTCAMQDYCSGYSSGPLERTPCLDWYPAYGIPRVPCADVPSEALPNRSQCWRNYGHAYYEWEC